MVPPTVKGPLAAVVEVQQGMLDRCEALWRIVLYLGQCMPDVETRRAIGQLRDWFDQAAGIHATAEQHLYPSIVASLDGEEATWLREFTAGLAWQHRILEALWARLRETIGSLAAGDLGPDALDATSEFVRLMRWTIEREQSTVLPLAEELVDGAELARIAHAFGGAGRHGATAAAAA